MAKTPSMCRQHFQLIADVLASRHGLAKTMKEREVIETLMHDFAMELKHTNPNFDTDKFLEAAGLYD